VNPNSLPLALHLTLRVYARGRGYALSSDWLCACLGCNRRQLQYARRELEREYPILSDQRGFWICDNPAEYSAVISHAIKNLRADKARIDDLETCLIHTWPEYQPTLWEVA
jgi:hypothetical protein